MHRARDGAEPLLARPVQPAAAADRRRLAATLGLGLAATGLALLLTPGDPDPALLAPFGAAVSAAAASSGPPPTGEAPAAALDAPVTLEDAPAEDAPAEDAPAEDAPAEDAPAEEAVAPADAAAGGPGAPAPSGGPGSDAPDVDPEAPAVGHVLVVVRDPAGAPVEGAWVVAAGHGPAPADGIGDLGLRPAWEEAARTSTDAAGRAVLPLPAGGDPALVVHARRGALEGRSAAFDRERWRVEVVVAPPDPPPPGLGALILRARADGRAAGGLPLQVALTRRPIVLDGAYAGEDAGRATLRGTTDANGELPIGRLPTGAYDLVVSASGRADARLAAVVEAAAVRLDVDLDHPGRSASGSLVPPAGVDPAAVRVTVVTALGDHPGVVVRAPGGGGLRWRAPGLPPGEHLVLGEVAGHGARCERLLVAGALALEGGPTLSWAGAATVRGRLVAQDRAPVRGARLLLAPRWSLPGGVGRPRPPFVNRLVAEGRPRATAEAREAHDLRRVGLAVEATTDEDGRFALRGAAPGPYLLVGPHGLEAPLGVAGDLDLGEVVVVVEPAPPRRRVTFVVRIEVAPPLRLGAGSVELFRRGAAPRRLEVDRSGQLGVEVELAGYETFDLRASGVDQEGRPLFQAGPALELDASARSPVEVRLLPAARLSGRLLLPPALGGRAGGIVVREPAPAPPRPSPEGWWLPEGPAAPRWQAPAALGLDGAWSVGAVPAGRPLEVWAGASLLRRLTLEPGEEKEVSEDLSGRTVVQAVRVDDLPDPLASCSAVVAWHGGLARAPLLHGRGLVPGVAPGVEATLRLEVEEPRTGSFWTAELPLAEPGREPAVVQLPRWRGGLKGALPPGAAGPVRATGRAGPVVAAEVGVDAEGRFLLELPAGGWRLEARGCAPLDVQVRDAVETEVLLRPR